ncbi:hypothetical protein HQ524_01145 [Candidatus Uhrbacteria bacterium]|nr:hypothetical protein [Candidatus Uhrbacteria bacterium]
MKKTLNFVTISAAVLVGLTVGYFFLMLWGAELEGYGIGMELVGLFGSIVTGIALFGMILWLRKKERVDNLAVFLFPIVIFISFVGIVWFVVTTPLQREHRIILDNNPLQDGGESVGKTVYAGVLSRQYWMNKLRANENLTDVYNEREKNSRLIKFSDPKTMPELIGISNDMVLEAFGIPVRKYLEGEYEVWIYNPWQDNADWEMSVYMLDGQLAVIGNLSMLSEMREKWAILIKYSDPVEFKEIKGISRDEAMDLFGKPRRATATNGSSILFYLPWEGEREHEMSVHFSKTAGLTGIEDSR